ncbi:MAG: xanthine dehydrogenase family protein molybdopterin-binding subunit [Rhodocyclaceae bacterium]|jgi:isoquinoline 1-oxidoreductase beta subunit|nr:xanthine dehydrogenase family protein molybdopterin-binding subunit [Rhodocyclaceae bacterium]MCA3146670.1 xanthine dehydrogenase family protein molybdopterin-binding subunit [Rhodocyclaceae bacterium]
MNAILNPERRAFLVKSAAAAGGLAIGVRLLPDASAAGAAEGLTEVTHWIVIEPDDSVTVRIARSELGQGTFTGLPMLVAEELECDWSKVRAEYADVNEHIRRNRVFGSMSTGGSRGIRDSHKYMREAGAAARQMLVAAAAQQWGVEASELGVAKGVVFHTPSGRAARFGQLAGAASKLPVPKEPALKDPAQWKLVGTSPPRFDIPAKTTGAQVYAADVRLPGMLHASVMQCPVFGGKLKAHDASKVIARRGVQRVVAGPDWVAVVADNWWRANEALKALPVEWDTGEHGATDDAAIERFLRTGLAAAEVPVARKDGDAAAAFAGAAKIIEAEYSCGFLNHATLEPQCAAARVTDDRVEVWVGTQNGETTIAAASEVSGVPLDKVIVHKMHAGGGFGRRGPHQEYTKQAVLIAREMPGTPVRVQWSREEDMRQGRYRPVSIVKQRAALDAQGNWIGWHVRQADQSIMITIVPDNVKNGLDPINTRSFSDNPYSVPHFVNEYAMRNPHVPPGFWRAVAHTQNPFYRECFIDEIAHATGRDPYALRRPLLEKKPRDLACLDAVARAIGWGAPAPKGVFRGIAVQDSYGSYSAAAVELSMKGDKGIQVRRVVVALDSGHVVHRDAVEAQIQSGVIWGLSMSMHEDITIKDGRVQQSNFTDYPVLRLAETPPAVESIIMPSGGFWGGVGEPPIAAVPAALCNALFAATGVRVRALPLRKLGYFYA